jgi:glycolate oxidase
VAVSRSRIVDLIDAVEVISKRLGIVIGVFGHAGDGNLHPTVIFDDANPQSRAAVLAAFDEITRKTLQFGGTITGEHGVGRLKRAWLARELDPAAQAVHAAIKSALDPQGLLNPGAVLARS